MLQSSENAKLQSFKGCVSLPTTKYRWQFPPRNGGVEVINDPSAAFFKDNPIAKLVREVIQNSLDACEPGIQEPVCVTFADMQVERNLIGSSQLYRHIVSCLNRAIDEGRPESICNLYQGAVETLKNSHIRCLRITDTNTTGLQGRRWDALVTQEGSVEKADIGAPGGSFGIGKNAIFNVSDLLTVFYSTHYLDRRRGRVDRLQGKATLMSHPNPAKADESLQHTGFYTDVGGEPIEGRRNIDPFFLLNEPGTGVYVMGFNPRVGDWVGDVIRAVLRNFFFAIHRQTLVVCIESGTQTVRITHESLQLLFEQFAEDLQESYDYYRAIRDTDSVVTEPIQTLGSLDLYIKIDSGPRRMAYVNRNGMLITDSREKKDNPIPPNNRSLWPDFAAVIIPSTDSGDRLVRRMENPSHDSISASQLREPSEQRKMVRAFRAARKVIQQIMDDKTHLAQSGNQANLRELAEMFPELDATRDGVTSLVTREISPRYTEQPAFEELDENGQADNNGALVESGSDGDLGGELNGNRRTDNNRNGRNHLNGDRGTSRESGNYGSRSSRVSLRRVRVMSTGSNNVIVAFNPIGKAPHQVTFALRAAGEEFQYVEPIGIRSVKLLNGKKGQSVTVDGDVVSLSSEDAERAFIEIETIESIENLAFRMGVQR